MSDYSKMTQEDFDRILKDILSEQTGAQLLNIPGIYEVISEHFNNEVLERWDEEQEEKKDTGPIQQAIDDIDEITVEEYLEADPDDVLRIHIETGETCLKPWQIGENRHKYLFIEAGEREYRFDTVEELQTEFQSQYEALKKGK